MKKIRQSKHMNKDGSLRSAKYNHDLSMFAEQKRQNNMAFRRASAEVAEQKQAIIRAKRKVLLAK